jgi:hypothetical protein
MPNNYDFSTLRNVKTTEINPIGWINPLTIEYGVGDGAGANYIWRVKGTLHCFTIPVLRLNFLSAGEYSQHFKEVLEYFKKEDYDSWRVQGFSAPWMKEYEKDYRRSIL